MNNWSDPETRKKWLERKLAIIFIVFSAAVLLIYRLGFEDGKIDALKKCYKVYLEQTPWECS